MLLKRVENLDDFTSPPSSETEPRLIWLLLRRFMASLMDPMSCTIASSRVRILPAPPIPNDLGRSSPTMASILQLRVRVAGIN